MLECQGELFYATAAHNENVAFNVRAMRGRVV